MVRGQPHRLRLRLPGSKPLSKKSTRRRMRCAPSALCRTSPSCAAMPKHATRPNPGAASGAPSPASKPLRSGSTPASSSPTSNAARPNGSTTLLLRERTAREPHRFHKNSSLPIEHVSFRDRKSGPPRAAQAADGSSVSRLHVPRRSKVDFERARQRVDGRHELSAMPMA